jgi:hypothetical protein
MRAQPPDYMSSDEQIVVGNTRRGRACLRARISRHEAKCRIENLIPQE